ncbi:hypothetical protein AeNC1_016791 [Aphanomyces euteiches]|nr:hypothetical protein AeNC1_016791 [Aphanomyces euteiches]
MLQTLSITRPQMQLISSGGAAMWTKTNLKSMKIGDDGQVTSSESASYSVAIGFTFPYESTNFYPVVLEDSVPPDGQWRAQVVSTREKFLFAGTSGIYRRAPSIQGSFNYFYWELPSDPLEFVAKIQFVGGMVFKDSWGWFRCFLGIGIGSNIAVNFGVSLLVVINMYRENNILWIPDVYPSIQSRAMIRASLLLLDCIMNSWWYPYQWAINQGSKRNHWGGTLDFNESSRADGLMAVLAITYLTAKTLHVRVQLVIVVYIYAMCYYMRQSVIASCGLFLEKVTPFIKKNYFENILPTGNNAMDLWAYHENRSTNFWLIANECTYLIVATGRLRDKITNLIATLHFVRWRHVCPIIQYMVRQRMTNPAAAMAHIAWNRRSTLYHELNELDVENTNVERCMGSILEHINGFVALTKDYIYEGGRIYVSPSGVWLLGFVIVNDQLLACSAAGYVLYCDVMGSLVNNLSLFGVSAKPNNTLAYQTTLLPQFLPTLVQSRDAVGATLRSMLGYTDIPNAVAYLDADITTQQPVLQDIFCRKTVGYDYLFNVTYLKPVVHHVFASFSDWNMSKWWIIVDCSFEGREIADTTVIKFYLLSKDMALLTTFLVQTLTITRPEKQLGTAGGVAMWTTTTLDSFQIQDNGRIVTSYKAQYCFAIGFSFPFDWQQFDPITIERLEPPDGQWHAQVTSTKERFTFSGTSGIFRRSPRVQGSFNYWFWRLPSNPIEFMSTLQFVRVKVFKDSWGWFRCLLCDGISSNIFVNFVVSILVMANIYWKEKTIWIPDVYPSFQKRAAVRAGLVLVDCVINGWWYPFQWAINQSSVRNHWGGTLDYNEISLDDGIVVILAIA